MRLGNLQQAAILAFLPVLLVAGVGLAGPAAAQTMSSECRKALAELRTQPLIRAFALSSDNNWCGMAWGFDDVAEARQRAIAECRKRTSRACRVTEVSPPASAPVSDDAKAAFDGWKGKPGYKAFALSGAGHAWGYSSNHATMEAAARQALELCSSKFKGCHIIASTNDEHELAGREWTKTNLDGADTSRIARIQEQLNALGCGDLKVDGRLGANTYRSIGACEKFLGRGTAEQDNSGQVVTALLDESSGDNGEEAIPPSGKRVALVFGNSDYSELTSLENPGNDAQGIAAALRSTGFEVMLALDAGRVEMEDKLADFARSARDADAALVYYAGHGIQHNGVNYLVPVDGNLEDETDLRRFIKVHDVISDLQGSSGVKILVLDACRDNEAVAQLASKLPKTRSAAFTRGLANERAQGVLIAFAAQPGAVAVDGLGENNSPFTSALLKHMTTPNLELRTLLTKVRADVYSATDGGQLPETSDSMIGEFRFVR